MALNCDSEVPDVSMETEKVKNGSSETSKQLLYSEMFSSDTVGLLKKDSVKKTFRPPPSSILSQVKTFLPQMMEANSKLEARLQDKPEELDIENIGDEDGCHIEMNLALVENDGTGSDDDDEEEDDEDDEDDDDGEILVQLDNEKPIQILTEQLNKDSNKKPRIEVLDPSSDNSAT